MTVHPLEGCITATLQRKMELRTEIWQRCQNFQIFVSEYQWFQRTQTHPLDSFCGARQCYRIYQMAADILAIAGKVDTYQYHLFVSLRTQIIQFQLQIFQ